MGYQLIKDAFLGTWQLVQNKSNNSLNLGPLQSAVLLFCSFSYALSAIPATH